ncbi:MAG: ABC transporter permease subunit, partial [Candidatus Babeliales bacterium]|nr:ABC transporter permease subunit [Candidatus Babeliales bacterium]
MGFDLSIAYYALPYLLKGAWVTIKIACVSYFIGFILGTILGFLQTRNSKLLSIPITIYVILIRGTPMLIQITFFYYVLPLIGIDLSHFWAATYAIALNSSAYISQIVKSGIAAVGKEQIEAARVLGLSSFQIARYIVNPQA